jgi:nucleobase:cation symporter-1, NCS1 family
MAALAAGIAFALLGLVISPLHILYDYAWFTGLATAGVLYLTLMQGWPPPVDTAIRKT